MMVLKFKGQERGWASDLQDCKPCRPQDGGEMLAGHRRVGETVG